MTKRLVVLALMLASPALAQQAQAQQRVPPAQPVLPTHLSKPRAQPWLPE